MTVEIFRRTRIESSDKYDFFPRTRQYTRQYAGFYWYRLETLKPQVLESARFKWSSAKYVEKLFDIMEDELCFIIGTVFMQIPGKPNVLADIAEDAERLINIEIPSSYLGDDESQNSVYLEDYSGRIQLDGDFLPSLLMVTGTIVGVLGKQIKNGTFEVIDIVYAGLASNKLQHTLHMSETPKYIAFVSGLNISATDDGLSYEILSDFLSGQLPSPQLSELSSQISRLIIAGNSISYKRPSMRKLYVKKSANETENYEFILKRFKRFIKKTCPFIDIDLIPGADDPSSMVIPQRPFHKALVVEDGSETMTINAHTNPCRFTLGGIDVLGTAGQTVDDICRYQKQLEPLKAMEHCLKWRHIAPTAPDTLYCYPFNGGDPFLMAETPNVFFAGNQSKFESCIVEDEKSTRCLIFTIPKFSETKELVLLNVNTMSVKSLKININIK